MPHGLYYSMRSLSFILVKEPTTTLLYCRLLAPAADVVEDRRMN